MKPNEIDKIRDIALSIKKREPKAAFDLLTLALKYRPNGPGLIKYHKVLKEELAITTLSSDGKKKKKIECAFVPAESFALLLTAFLRKKSEPFILITPNEIQLSQPVLKIIKESGGMVNSTSEVSNDGLEGVRHIWVHSFGHANISLKIINRYNLTYSIYSDALKNEIGQKAVNEFFPEYQSILTFGFFWYQPFFRNDALLALCSFNEIITIFQQLTNIVQVDVQLTEEDYTKDWLFLRYWGQGHGEFNHDYDYLSVIKEYLAEKNILSVLVKGDSRIKAISTEQLVEELNKTIIVDKIEDKFYFNNPSIENKDTFFAETMIPNKLNGSVHVFDSSLSIYIALTSNAHIQFPSESLIKKVFKNESFSNAVSKYTSFYKFICNHITELKEKKFFSGDDFFVVKNIGKEFVVSKSIGNKIITIKETINESELNKL
jgi:hypothetical protein